MSLIVIAISRLKWFKERLLESTQDRQSECFTYVGKPFNKNGHLTFLAAPALQTARDTPRMAFAPSFAVMIQTDSRREELLFSSTTAHVTDLYFIRGLKSIEYLPAHESKVLELVL